MTIEYARTGAFPAALALLGTAGLLALGRPAAASDLEYAPQRIKRFGSSEKCLVDLRQRREEALRKVGTTVTETDKVRQTTIYSVTEIQSDGKGRTWFSDNTQFVTQDLPPGRGGGRVGSGTDWYCQGRDLWQGGGQSAYVPDIVLPEPPPTPPMPCNALQFTIRFDWNKIEITPEAKSMLDMAVSAYRDCPNYSIFVDGHSDSSGNAAYNQDLSERRSQAVRGYLASHGLPDSKITVSRYGEDRPVHIVPDGTRDEFNRRVDIMFSE